MKAEMLTLEEIRVAGLDALTRELGPVGMTRFLQQFEIGRGNYTQERHQWLGTPNVEALAEEIRRARAE